MIRATELAGIVASEDAVSYDWTDEDLPIHEPGGPVRRWGNATADVPRTAQSRDESLPPVAWTRGEPHVG